MDSIVRVVGISGSLRAGSFNTMLLREAIRVAPEDVKIDVAEIGDFPLYNQDLDSAGPVTAVQRAKNQIAASDAVLIATPEYNFGLPGPLKNAIDWLSRPAGLSPLIGKPLGMMGASPGMLGTVRAQISLRQTAVFLDMHPVNKPEVFIARAHEKFDAEGRLTDEMGLKMVVQLLGSLRDWAKKLSIDDRTGSQSPRDGRQ